jgi:predicted metalloenzyme YecM
MFNDHLILTLRCNIALVCGRGSLAHDCLFVESNRVFTFKITNFGNVMNVAMDEAYHDNLSLRLHKSFWRKKWLQNVL